MYGVSVPVALFLMSALCFLIYEESWRVEGKICDDIGSVEMEECEETAEGYRDLCWVLVAIFSLVAVVMMCLIPGVPGGLKHLEATSSIRRWQPSLHICPVLSLILIISFYSYFLTLLLFQVSSGDHETRSVPVLPQQEVRHWSYHPAERILVFFTVGMSLWWFSFLAHFIEYITASMTIKGFFDPNEDQFEQLRSTLRDTGKYHMGTILVDAVVIPLGRLPRNIAVGIKSILMLGLSEESGIVKCCLCGYTAVFQYMTSTTLALQAYDRTSFLQSAKHARNLLSRHSKKNPERSLNQADRLIWLTQLVVTLIGPVFVAYWIQHEPDTFRDGRTAEITSVTAMAVYSLVLTWALAQLYGCFVRGVVYGCTVAYLLKEEMKEKSPTNGEVEVSFSIAAEIMNVPEKKKKRSKPPALVPTEVEKALVNPPTEVVPPPSPKHDDVLSAIHEEGLPEHPPDT